VEEWTSTGNWSCIGGLEHGSFRVVNRLAHETTSVVDGLEQRTSNVAVYVCSEDWESEPLLLGEE